MSILQGLELAVELAPVSIQLSRRHDFNSGALVQTHIGIREAPWEERHLLPNMLKNSIVQWLLLLTPQTLVSKCAHRKQLSNHVYSYGVQIAF